MAIVTGLTAEKANENFAASVVGGSFNGFGHLILVTGDATEIDAGLPDSIIDASETEKGLIELATTAEVATGTDTVRAVTPAGLAALVATSSAKGIVELATNAEVATGTDTARAVTPAGLAALVSSATAKGIVELATDAETITGTDATRATTPASVKAATDAIAAASITPRPLGIVARRTRTSGSGATASTAGVAVIKLSYAVISGRGYRVFTNALHLTSGLADEVGAVIRYTTLFYALLLPPLLMPADIM